MNRMKRFKCSIFCAVLLIAVFITVDSDASVKETNRVYLTFYGTTVSCLGTCSGNYTSDSLSATLSLYRGQVCIDTWTGTDTGKLILSGSHNAVHGATYRLEMSYSINGITQTPISTTSTCPQTFKNLEMSRDVGRYHYSLTTLIHKTFGVS